MSSFRKEPLTVPSVLRGSASAPAEDAQKAIELTRRVAELAEFLAGRGLTITLFSSGFSAFGSWSIHVQKGTTVDQFFSTTGRGVTAGRSDVVQVSWDGMENQLSVERIAITGPQPWNDRGAWVRVQLKPPSDSIATAQQLLLEAFDVQ